MTVEEIEVGQEVICTYLRRHTRLPQDQFRSVGHIGKVVSVFPLKDIALIAHIESTDEAYVEYVTAYFIDELEIYKPANSSLQQAIKNTLEMDT